MFDYGSARHSRKKRTLKSVSNSSRNRHTESVVGSFVPRLRFFIGCIVALIVSVYALIHFVLPSVLTLPKPVSLIVTQQASNKDRFYFIHLNPNASLNYSTELPSSEEVSVPFLDQKISLDTVYQEHNEMMTTITSHALGLLVHSTYRIIGHNDQEFNKITDIFAVTFDKKAHLSPKERVMLLYYFILAQKNDVEIQDLASVKDVASELSDNQAIWEYSTAHACPIAVINTTATQGLANSYSTILEKSGAFIIRVTSESTLKDKSIIYTGENEACEELIEGIQELFPQKLEVAADTAITQEYRSGIVLFLGKDAYSL